MRRYLLLLLVLLLPAQSVLATAARYCAHEQTEMRHLGHHQHQHADNKAPVNNDDGPLSDHPDCAAHHMSVAAIVTAASPTIAMECGTSTLSFTLPTFSSLSAQRPERPQWSAAL